MQETNFIGYKNIWQATGITNSLSISYLNESEESNNERHSPV